MSSEFHRLSALALRAGIDDLEARIAKLEELAAKHEALAARSPDERCKELLAEQRKINHEAMEAYAQAEVAAERERCARIAETFQTRGSLGVKDIAAAIRRGEP